jgi:N-acyl-D-amino-acid deacylase
LDVVIKNGWIVDGTGNPFFRADIGVDEGRIICVGDLRRSQADRVVDASRLIVCPGFIDIHSHSDFVLITNPTMDAKIYQGVTSELNGNCGHSPSPLIGPEMRKLRYYPKKIPEWSTTKEYFKVLEERGHAVNTMSLLGYVNVRVAVVGLEERDPNENELGLMKALVAQGMEDGLFGLSTGLEYPPSSFATTEELIELCQIVSDYGGVYVSHVRNESRLLVEAVEEAVRIGMESGVGVECVHHKAFGRIYSDRIPITLNIIDEAREKGVDVTLDVYPYIRDSGDFTGWLPAWAHAGGPEELMKRLINPETRRKIKAEINNLIEEPESLLSTAILTWLRKNPELSGKTVAELAETVEIDIIDFAIDLLIKEEGVGVGISSEFGTEENLEKILSHPASMIGSDGSGVSVYIKEWTHPRNYGTYARLMERYVREKRILTLQEAIRKCTSFPAQRLGLKERGLIREGMWADITIFDYNKINDNFSLTNPNQYAEGVEYVLVNGRLVLDEGRHTGNLPGKVLKKGQS